MSLTLQRMSSRSTNAIQPNVKPTEFNQPKRPTFTNHKRKRKQRRSISFRAPPPVDGFDCCRLTVAVDYLHICTSRVCLLCISSVGVLRSDVSHCVCITSVATTVNDTREIVQPTLDDSIQFRTSHATRVGPGRAKQSLFNVRFRRRGRT